MTCNEFWNGEDHPLDHLKECPACAARFARHEEVTAGLRTLGRQMRRVAAPARVERSLVAAFRASEAFGRPTPRTGWWLAGAWAAALAVTALAAVALMRPHEPVRTRQMVRSRTQLAAVEPAFDGAALTAAADGDAGEDGFLTLPNVEAVGPNDEINLVRVEVPRSAMIPLGFDVSADRAQETVEADVMLDADGVARAVRFLDSEITSRESGW
jgi:hypothetical protein